MIPCPWSPFRLSRWSPFALPFIWSLCLTIRYVIYLNNKTYKKIEGGSMNKDISVIIITRNRPDILVQSVSKVMAEQAHSSTRFEILIIDTSTQPTWISTGNDDVIRYYYFGNISYSMVLARNTALGLAQSEIVAFIDDDCFIHPGWIDQLLLPYQDHNVVAVGGRIIYHPWKSCLTDTMVANIDLDNDLIFAQWDKNPEKPIKVSHLPGGNFSVRTSCALQVGGFDTNYIGSANLEETDFFYRLNKIGDIVFNPKAVVEHREAPRTDGIKRDFSNYLYRYSMVRNRIYFLRKYKSYKGLKKTIHREVLVTAYGSLQRIKGVILFFFASVFGILGGLLTSLKPGSKRLAEFRYEDRHGS